MNAPNTFRAQPDERGHFGDYGGRYVAETLMPLVLELEREYRAAKSDPAFQAQFDDLLEHYVGRPSPLYYAERLTAALRESAPDGRGAEIWFKRDELNHTGAHKINNCIGQILLAIRMGKTRIIAETGAGQHGVATATVCARFGLPCVIYMGAKDVERQQPNVFRMKLLGAEVRAVSSGANTLKDAMNEALRDWVANVHDTFYIIGTAAGPHPYPELVRDFQSVIGREAREQMLARTGRLPDLLVAAIGGGSNAIGLFHPFLDDADVNMLGVEAAGEAFMMRHRYERRYAIGDTHEGQGNQREHTRDIAGGADDDPDACRSLDRHEWADDERDRRTVPFTVGNPCRIVRTALDGVKSWVVHDLDHPDDPGHRPRRREAERHNDRIARAHGA